MPQRHSFDVLRQAFGAGASGGTAPRFSGLRLRGCRCRASRQVAQCTWRPVHGRDGPSSSCRRWQPSTCCRTVVIQVPNRPRMADLPRLATLRWWRRCQASPGDPGRGTSALCLNVAGCFGSERRALALSLPPRICLAQRWSHTACPFNGESFTPAQTGIAGIWPDSLSRAECSFSTNRTGLQADERVTSKSARS